MHVARLLATLAPSGHVVLSEEHWLDRPVRERMGRDPDTEHGSFAAWGAITSEELRRVVSDDGAWSGLQERLLDSGLPGSLRLCIYTHRDLRGE